MLKNILFALILVFTVILSTQAQSDFKSDIFKTSSGDLEIFFIGHGTLMINFQDKVIHIDPVSRECDY